MKSSFVFLIGFLLGFVCLGYADDAAVESYPQSGTVVPIMNDAIEMVLADVLFKDGQFTTTFNFYNTTDKNQDVTIGFPVIGGFQHGEGGGEEIYETKEKMMEAVEKYFKFRTFINGKERKRKLEEISPSNDKLDYRFIYTTKIQFKPKQKIVILNRYFSQPIKWEDSIGDTGEIINYILKTGASWKGNIKKEHVRLLLPKKGMYKAAGYKLAKFSIRDYSPKSSAIYKEGKNYHIFEWNFDDFEPNEDINIWIGYFVTSDNFIFRDIFNGLLKLQDEEQIKLLKEMQDKEIFNSFINSLISTNLYLKNEEGRKYCDNNYSVPPQLLINSLYALKGYKFNNPEWTNFYKNFKWYKPITDKPTFSQEEKDLIEKLTKIEKSN